MTAVHIATALEQLAELLKAANAGSHAKNVKSLSDLLAKHSSIRMPQLAKQLASTTIDTTGWFGTPVAEILPVLHAYQAPLQGLAPRLGKELAPLIALLEKHRNADLAAFLKSADTILSAPPPVKGKKAAATANEEVVARYADPLKSSLGTSDFDALFKMLSKDKAVRKQEISEIARRIMSVPPSSSDKKSLLKSIADLDAAAKGIDLKLKATHGRSAA